MFTIRTTYTLENTFNNFTTSLKRTEIFKQSIRQVPHKVDAA